jgi:alpha-L-arabinofuranosidase
VPIPASNANRFSVALVFAIAIFLSTSTQAQVTNTATMTVQVNQPGAVVSSNLFGIFFEEINYAGEGGLYAEMVRNRSFKNSANPDFWTLVTNGVAAGTMTVDSSQPLNAYKPCSLNLTMLSGTGSIGAANSGFFGMSVQSGATYNLGFYAMASSGFPGSITVQLQNSSGSTVYAQTSFSGLTTSWQKFTAALVSSGTDTSARILVKISNSGTIWLDEVSLFPQATFNARTNGIRADLANMLAAMHPSFMRYPGGNFIESQNVTNAVRWKTTVGDTALRPGHVNDSWGYWSTDGFGLEEYLQFCEDVGMAPLYGINAGLCLGYNGSTNNTVPLAQMGPWVQDAVDLIQYANGDTNTTWGAMRAANGHPAAFNLQYLEIGNENGGSYYNDRYTLFYDAVKSSYPNVQLISPGNWAGGPPTSRPRDISDEHYYSSAGTFIGYATKYDSYSRSGPKVFVGEYAVTSGYGTYGNLSAALGEASFMTGMERNSDIVQLASYAPLFANVGGVQWHPDLIYYNNSQVFGTPSYYVQKMFSQNRGDSVLPTSIVITNLSSGPKPRGTIGVGSWNTAVQYTNITVTSNSVALYQSDFVNQGTNGWRVFNGTWGTNSGLYQQTALITDCYSTYTNNSSTNWANYTISLQARKSAGSEGFLILFNFLDDNNWTWWNIGGWNNTLDGIEQMVGGAKTTYAQVSQNITANTWYYIRIVVTGARAQCYLGTNSAQAATNLVQDVTLPTATSGLLASTTYSKASGQVVIKAVNPYTSALTTTFNLAGVSSIAPSATVIQLTSGSPSDENSFAAPTFVSPVTNSISNAGTNFILTLPANSLSILRLNATGINAYTNLSLQIPSPMTNGVSVPSTVLGQQSGNWINLSGNTNHALVFSSANTNIAVVDINGNVTGVGSGTTSIIVSYPALSLTATQAVQVLFIPPTLVHRYSFSETSGTVAADSVGGPVWNGSLPNGGTFGGGQLALSSNIQQYLQLPGGILSNYTQVTVETWVTFPDQLPVNCFFFGFGNTNGTSGQSYIFCAPRAGRAAITSGNFSLEQNANTGVDFSFHTNFHLTFVFNPPAGYLAIYTNGILSAINTSVTTTFASVTNVYSLIGRSLYSGDPYPDFTLDEFRIYNGALQSADISATEVLGPDQVLSSLPPVVTTSASNNFLTMSWPVASSSYTVAMSTNLSFGNWVPISATPQILGNQWQVTLPVTTNSEFFRLQK